MSFTFRPATREAAKLLIGLCGPSGSGKTLSALRLATGLGGPIAYIDTEQGRALQYAGDYEFLHGTLPPPFSPDRYREAVDAAVAIKPNVVILDSASHVWEGPGGILESVDTAKREGGNDFGVWAKPKQAHQKLMNRLMQVPAHVIICFRAKEKRGLVKNERGKTEVVDLGWHPICEGGVVYELTVNVLLSSDKKGTPIVDGFDFGKLPYNMQALLPAGEQISEATGKRFAEWCRNDPPPAQTNGHAKPATLDLLDASGAVAGTYDSAGNWLAGLELVASDEAVLAANYPTLTKIANSARASAEQRDVANALRERVSQAGLI